MGGVALLEVNAEGSEQSPRVGRLAGYDEEDVTEDIPEVPGRSMVAGSALARCNAGTSRGERRTESAVNERARSGVGQWGRGAVDT